MQNLSVKQKLWSLIGLFISILVIYGVINSHAFNVIETDSHHVSQEALPELIHFTTVEKNVLAVQDAFNEAMLENDPHKLEVAKHDMEIIQKNINALKELLKDNPSELEKISKINEEILSFYNQGVSVSLKHINEANKNAELIHEIEAFGKQVTQIEEELEHEVAYVQKNVDGNTTEIYEQAEAAFFEGIIILIIAVLISLIGGALMAKNIITSVNSIQSGLLSFFHFLNRETAKADTIQLDSKDEFGQMAKVINQNITKTETLINQDTALINDVKRVVALVKEGKIKQQIRNSTANEGLEELKKLFNEMLEITASNVCGDINKIQKALESYRKLDFTHRISDPTGQTSKGLNELADIINDMLSNSLKGGVDLQHDASNLKQAVETLSTASNEQAASLEETAAAIEEMTSNVQSNAQKANDMARMASQTDESAKQGAELANRTAVAMTEIQQATQSINNAVAIIENIAFQTNILSLNAAVEAATAGEAGKGFAVVAQEVRNLANRSADAAKEIKALAEQAASKSDEGMNIANELTKGFEVIADKIEQTTMLVQDVSNASREQMQGIGQINTAVTQLDQMTQENAKVAAEADNIANATISKAVAMVEDASNKNFIGKEKINVSTHTQRASIRTAPSVSRPMTSSAAHKPAPKNHDDDVWESF